MLKNKAVNNLDLIEIMLRKMATTCLMTFKLMMMMVVVVKEITAMGGRCNDLTTLECNCMCNRTMSDNGCQDYPDEVAFTKKSDFEGPACSDYESITPCHGSSNCGCGWKCCKDNFRILCDVEFHHVDTEDRKEEGNCGNYTSCTGTGNQRICCYKVFCECHLPGETTSMSPSTSKQPNLSTFFKQTTTDFEHTSSDSDRSMVSNTQSSTPGHQSTTTEKIQQKPVASTAAPSGYATATYLMDLLDQTSDTLSSDENLFILDDAATLGFSQGRSQGSSAGIGVGITILLLMVVIIAFIFYYRKRSNRREEKVIQDPKVRNVSIPSEPYAEIDQNTYAGAKTMNSGTTNPSYDDIHKPVITGSSDVVYAEPTAPTNDSITPGYQSVRKESNVYAEPTNPDPDYPDKILTPAGSQSLPKPNDDFGEGVYQDPDRYMAENPVQGVNNNTATNPNYGDISPIGITGSLKKLSQPDEDMGSEEYQDPQIYRDANTGQNPINAVENPDYDGINNITIPPAPNITNTDFKKQPRQNYTDLQLDNTRIPAHYQSLKKPNEDMGGATYADPDQYTYRPRSTTDIGEATYADPDKFTAVPTLKNDENQDGKGEKEGTTDSADPEYFTLEPPESANKDVSKDNDDTLTGNDDDVYFTLEPPPQDDREYSVPPDAQGSQK